MGAGGSKPSVSRASPPLSEPRSPPTASVLAKETRDGARGSSGVLTCIRPSEAAGPVRKRLRSAVPEDGGDAKRIKDAGNGGVPDTLVLHDDGQFQHASAGGSLLFSCPPLGASSDMVVGSSGSAHGVQPMSLFQLDGAKHKIFLSHSGAQKDFVEQLCVDLEHKGYFFPFFDQRHHSLPKGEDFAPLIIQAARLCRVAVIVLSEEFLCSKWPMIELAEFHAAQQGVGGDGGKLKLLPLFFKLSIEEVQDEGRWMPIWKKHVARDHRHRIDLFEWSAAVRALCNSNGLDFEKVARKEVAYRKWVVESIVTLSPPDLLFGISKSMVGLGRMCEAMASQFMEDPNVGARVLGIYGMVGLGKTMLAKALHDYLYGEFLGKVYYVDMGHGSRAWRQNSMLKELCGFEKDVVDRMGVHVEKGLMQMRTYMKRDPVFLVIDNVTHDAQLLEEVEAYLRMGFHRESRIMITSSSKAILEELLPNMGLYTPMPTLILEEAKTLFLKRAAPMRTISELTSEEQNILGICIEKCWFHCDEGDFYHPVALTALADAFSCSGRTMGNRILFWKDRLETDLDLVKDVLKSPKGLFGILNLQFQTFDSSEKLLFLDLALFRVDTCIFEEGLLDDVNDIGWLPQLHDESLTSIETKLWALINSGMIEYRPDDKWPYLTVPSVYREFAKWYAADHKVNGLKNAWGVFQPGGGSSSGDSSTPIKCLSNLIRLRIDGTSPTSARLVASNLMQNLPILEVLQLGGLDLTMLNLEGLHCLRVLELSDLPKLVTITLSRNSSRNECAGIYDSLQHVRLHRLESLVHLPDLRPCTSLHSVVVICCEKVGNYEGADCRSLKKLALYIECLERLVDFERLESLEHLWIRVHISGGFRGRWTRKGIDSDFLFEDFWKEPEIDMDRDLKAVLEGGGRCAKLLENLLQLLSRSEMICTFFEREW